MEIDSEIARLRNELLDTQNRIQGLAEKRGKVLASLEEDTSFRRKIREGTTKEQSEKVGL